MEPADAADLQPAADDVESFTSPAYTGAEGVRPAAASGASEGAASRRSLSPPGDDPEFGAITSWSKAAFQSCDLSREL